MLDNLLNRVCLKHLEGLGIDTERDGRRSWDHQQFTHFPSCYPQESLGKNVLHLHVSTILVALFHIQSKRI